MTKPVAFYDPHKGFYWARPTKTTAPVVVDVEPLALYTKRTWVGLTPDELNAIFDGFKTWSSFQITDVYFAIEAKLRSKNS